MLSIKSNAMHVRNGLIKNEVLFHKLNWALNDQNPYGNQSVHCSKVIYKIIICYLQKLLHTTWLICFTRCCGTKVHFSQNSIPNRYTDTINFNIKLNTFLLSWFSLHHFSCCCKSMGYVGVSHILLLNKEKYLHING